MPSDDAQFSFYTAERGILLARIDSDVQETRRIERYVILATAAVYTWLATSASAAPIEAGWAWWIPLGLAVLGVVRCLAILTRINVMAEYIMLIEQQYASVKDVPGWRTFFQRRGRGKVTWAVSVSWLILLITTLVIPLLVNGV